MKEHVFYPSILFLGLFLATTCHVFTKADDCHSDRKTTETIKDQSGTILELGDDLWVIALNNSANNTRYSPCNLTDEWKVSNKMITFSGKVKEIYPNERWAGTPFVITKCN